MRKIEYRGFSPRRNEWVYGCILQKEFKDGTLTYIVTNMKVKVELFQNYDCTTEVKVLNGDCIPVELDSVGMNTCMKDVTGRDIYEGDILQVVSLDEREPLKDFPLIEVRYVRGVFAYLKNGSLNREMITNCPTHEWAKVVGNVFENPGSFKKR